MNEMMNKRMKGKTLWGVIDRFYMDLIKMINIKGEKNWIFYHVRFCMNPSFD